MAINNIPGSYRTAGTFSAPKVKASEEGLFKPMSGKVSGAMSDEYIEKIKSCARQAATSGKNMVESGFAAMRDSQMAKHISPDRTKAVSQVSMALNSVTRAWKSGKNILSLFGLPYTANVFKGPLKTTAEIFDENGEMIAGFHSDNGFWNSVPTSDETRGQYESNQIYREAYNAAKAELAAGTQQAVPGMSGGASAGFDVKA